MEQRASRHNEAGFSLIELIGVVGIFSVLLLALAGVFYSGIRTRGLEQAHLSLQKQGREALDKLSGDVKEASAILSDSGVLPASHNPAGKCAVPAPPGGSPLHTTGAQTVVLSLPAVTTSGTIPENPPGSGFLIPFYTDRVIFYLVTNTTAGGTTFYRLCRKVIPTLNPPYPFSSARAGSPPPADGFSVEILAETITDPNFFAYEVAPPNVGASNYLTVRYASSYLNTASNKTSLYNQTPTYAVETKLELRNRF